MGIVKNAMFTYSLWRDARAVEWGGLENRCACERTVGSNPTLSSISLFYMIQYCSQISLKQRVLLTLFDHFSLILFIDILGAYGV